MEEFGNTSCKVEGKRMADAEWSATIVDRK